MRYLVDTCIWIDLLEDRVGFNNEPLGRYASKFFLRLIDNGAYTSDITLNELRAKKTDDEINSMLFPFKMKTIISSDNQVKEALEISEKYSVPRGDALHAILARDNNLTLVTRDKHFKKLRDICVSKKPEEII